MSTVQRRRMIGQLWQISEQRRAMIGQRWRMGGAVIFCLALGWQSAMAAEPSSIASQVLIRRTHYGVPHIRGESVEAVAFGFGYCQAEDHLENIMRGVLETRGESARHFGPGSEGKQIETDFYNRQFRVVKRAVDSYRQLGPDYRAACEGFAAGLNFYVTRHRADVPPWAPRVSGHDVAAYGLAGVMRFAFNRSNLIQDFLKSQNVKVAVAPNLSDDEMVGSNMWAFAPSRSRSGRTLLLGNPHQGWAPVSTYYEAQLTIPGRLNFYGATFIGRPVLTSGWNEHLGWSHTVNAPDLEEIYELAIDPDRPDHYRFDDDSTPIEREDVTVEVRRDGGLSQETRTFWHTPLGPVIHRTPSKLYVLRSACYDNHQAYEQWMRMTETKNYAEFRQVVEQNSLPMFNICYADRVGNIFYLWNGTVPALPHAAHKAEAVPAARTADIWTRFHRTSELPQLINPPGGYVQNCNSPPYLTNLLAPLDPLKYPAYFSPNDLSLRTQHSLRLVQGEQRFTLEQICALKHSSLALAAERVKADLVEIVRAAKPEATMMAAIDAIAAWDNTVAVDSRGGTLFANWWDRYYDKGKGKFAVPWNAAEPTTTPRGIGDRERALTKFGEALQEVTTLYGRADVAWGETHRVRKGDQVDFPVSGGAGEMGCFRVLDFRQDPDGKLVANRGDSWVFAVEFSDPPRAQSVLAYSQSDVPSSPHFADQAALFVAGKMKPVAFTEAEIAAQLIKTYHPGEE
jgi:acyl-homoserine-lactone acylase